jgi:hypothetical protein
MFGYKRAAAAILALDTPLTGLIDQQGKLPKIPRIGPASARVIHEVLQTGGSPSVERAIDSSGRRAEIERRRALRCHFLSRAEVRRILHDPALTPGWRRSLPHASSTAGRSNVCSPGWRIRRGLRRGRARCGSAAEPGVILWTVLLTCVAQVLRPFA